MENKKDKKTVEVGRIVTTPAALSGLNSDDVWTALNRHMSCDWGDCCEDDAAANDFALDNALRLMSVYHDRMGTEFWIITEADRSVTTVLLPDDY